MRGGIDDVWRQLYCTLVIIIVPVLQPLGKELTNQNVTLEQNMAISFISTNNSEVYKQ